MRAPVPRSDRRRPAPKRIPNVRVARVERPDVLRRRLDLLGLKGDKLARSVVESENHAVVPGLFQILGERKNLPFLRKWKKLRVLYPALREARRFRDADGIGGVPIERIFQRNEQRHHSAASVLVDAAVASIVIRGVRGILGHVEPVPENPLVVRAAPDFRPVEHREIRIRPVINHQRLPVLVDDF